MTNRIATTIIALLLSLGLPACEVDTQPMPDDGGWGEGDDLGDETETETGTPPDLRPEPYDPNDLECCTCIDGYSDCYVVFDRHPTDLECLQWVLDNKGTTEPFYCEIIETDVDGGTNYSIECDVTCEHNA